MEDWLKIKRKAISANAKGWTIPGMFEYVRTLEKELNIPRGNVSFSRMINLIDRLTTRPSVLEVKKEVVSPVVMDEPISPVEKSGTSMVPNQHTPELTPPLNPLAAPIQKGGRKRKEVKPQEAPKDAASDGEKLSEPAEKPE